MRQAARLYQLHCRREIMPFVDSATKRTTGGTPRRRHAAEVEAQHCEIGEGW
jgi:hypothetical protein